MLTLFVLTPVLTPAATAASVEVPTPHPEPTPMQRAEEHRGIVQMHTGAVGLAASALTVAAGAVWVATDPNPGRCYELCPRGWEGLGVSAMGLAGVFVFPSVILVGSKHVYRARHAEPAATLSLAPLPGGAMLTGTWGGP